MDFGSHLEGVRDDVPARGGNKMAITPRKISALHILGGLSTWFCLSNGVVS